MKRECQTQKNKTIRKTIIETTISIGLGKLKIDDELEIALEIQRLIN